MTQNPTIGRAARRVARAARQDIYRDVADDLVRRARSYVDTHEHAAAAALVAAARDVCPTHPAVGDLAARIERHMAAEPSLADLASDLHVTLDPNATDADHVAVLRDAIALGRRQRDAARGVWEQRVVHLAATLDTLRRRTAPEQIAQINLVRALRTGVAARTGVTLPRRSWFDALVRLVAS